MEQNKSLPLYRRLLSLLKPYHGKMGAALVCMVGAGICAAIPAWLMKNVVDGVLIRKEYFMLNMLVVGLVVLFVLKAGFTYGQKYLMGWVGQKIVMDLRVAAYAHLQTLSLKFINDKRVGELLSRVTNDANMLQTTVSTVAVDLVIQGVSCAAMLGYCLYLNWRLMLYTLFILPIVVFVLKRASETLRKVGHGMQQRVADLSAVAEEALSAIRIVRAFATEELELGRFKESNQQNFDVIVQGIKVNALLNGAVEILLIVALALILWLGGQQVLSDRMTPGELIAFLGSLGFLASPINNFTRAVSQLQFGFAAAERIFGLLDNQDRVVTPPHAISLGHLRGEVVFEDVWFAYEGEQWILKGLNLRVKPGEKVAIVGTTGTGKSTLVDLIQRFYDPQRGRVTIDGYDLRNVDLKTLRQQIGVVPQDPVLMKGSIAFNISYGYQGTPDEIEKAADIADISGFIESLPDAYQTEVGIRGVTLSGGQRQRIAIARAVIRNPRIIILDEATSSLDAAVERQIQNAMDKAMVGRTSFIIAHRLSTIINADRILYLEKGRIIEEGRHEELLRKKGAYQKLFALQYGERQP
ncbi:MAG: ABC transporter ATP-binding protein [Pyramidobacter sp.]|jgi:subfamily B ATP-binding cassette protein MsbA